MANNQIKIKFTESENILENIVNELNKLATEMTELGYMCKDYQDSINNIINNIQNINSS